jgi:hypothetical protein
MSRRPVRAARVAVAVALAVALAACGGAGDEPSGSPEPGQDDLDEGTDEGTDEPADDPSSDDAELGVDEGIGNGRDDGPADTGDLGAELALARELLGEDAEAVVAERVTWSDGSLGCPEPDMMYTQALVEGYRIVLLTDEGEVAFHGASGEPPIRCDDPQEPLEDGVVDR